LFSQVVNDSLNPVWNQTFDFVVEDGLHEMLILEVYDHDTFGKVLVFSSSFATNFYLELLMPSV
jgi:Ca2+-dependent lipid-binding protein